MNELLIAFLILIITSIMIGAIYLICKADKKIIEVNNKVAEFKNINFENLRKVIEFLHKFNRIINLGKIKYYFEIILTAITTTQLFLLIKKLNKNNKADSED